MYFDYKVANGKYKIINIIKEFSNKPIKELVEIRKEMLDTCYHNKQLMKKRTNQRFYNEKGQYIHHKPTSDIVNSLWKQYNSSLV